MSKKILLILLFIIGLGLFFKNDIQLILQHITDKNWLLAYMQKGGWQAQFILFFASCVFVTLGGPKQIIAVLMGLAYGLYFGTFLTVVICLSGAMLNYACAYFMANRFITNNKSTKLQSFRAFIQQEPFYKILLLRVFPIGSNLVTNSLSGAIGVSLSAFINASILGYLPQVFTFSLLGVGIGNSNHLKVELSILLTVVSFILTAFIYHFHIKQRSDLPDLNNTTPLT